MKRIIVNNDGHYTHHGIGYTEHGGYGGMSDNRLPIKRAIDFEVRNHIANGEQYQLEVNGKIKGIFVK